MQLPLSTDFNIFHIDSDEDLNDILHNLPTEDVIELDSDSDDLLRKLPLTQARGLNWTTPRQTFVLVCHG